jgi:hypothetical protein
MPTSLLRSSQGVECLSTLISQVVTKIDLVLTIKPHKELGNTNFLELHHKPWELPGNPSHLGDSIPKNNKHNEVVKGEGEVLFLEGGTPKRAQIFSQEQDSRVKLRKRGERSRTES